MNQEANTVAAESRIYGTPEEAAAYLNVTPQVFGSLVKQYGVGRYHLPRQTDQIVYRLSDLENIKRTLGKQAERPGAGVE